MNPTLDIAALEKEVDRRLDDALSDPNQRALYGLDRDRDLLTDEREFLRRIFVSICYREWMYRDDEAIEEWDPIARYEPRRRLGRGGQGYTVLAIDHLTGHDVALKELAVGALNDWKALELFEREAAVLRSLDHPAIPKYIDAFHFDGANGRRFFIVQEYVDGLDLQRRLDSGERYDETRALEVISAMLDVLSYLHRLSPPVIHRDLKPCNIMQRTDGSYALIDFGAVQNAIPKTVGGSTIVGTPGYMPIEQVMGKSVPATDLYALGATVVHLMSGTHPADIETDRSRIDFESRFECSRRLKDVLHDLLEPIVDDRCPSAEAANQRLATPTTTAVARTSDRELVSSASFRQSKTEDGILWRFTGDTLQAIEADDSLEIGPAPHDWPQHILFTSIGILAALIVTKWLQWDYGFWWLIFQAPYWFFVGHNRPDRVRLGSQNLRINRYRPLPVSQIEAFEIVGRSNRRKVVARCTDGREFPILKKLPDDQAVVITKLLNQKTREQKYGKFKR